MKRPDPYCRSAKKWLLDPKVAELNPGRAAAHLHGKSVLAPLTGQDEAALSAFAHLVDLYTRADEDGRERAIEAMRATVLAAQEHVRPLFAEVIPHVYDWSERRRLWLKMGFRPLALDSIHAELQEGAGVSSDNGPLCECGKRLGHA